ncbi:MAG TPA: hypothetical protein VFH56_12675 [Acidimicrobiales bacterium]|nr:hypothetical protein [Acidimicrobiales bacterium]
MESRSAANGQKFFIHRSWTRLWWVAHHPNEEIDDWPYAHAWTRDRLIAKLRRRANEPNNDPWETIYV